MRILANYCENAPKLLNILQKMNFGAAKTAKTKKYIYFAALVIFVCTLRYYS